jgi:opacity protein-like surface antigen
MKTSVVVLLLLTSANAGAAAEAVKASPWKVDASLYVLLLGMSGQTSVGGNTLDVDVEVRNFLKYLELGAGGRARVEYERWSLALDAYYFRLGVTDSRGTAEGSQWMVEPTAGMRIDRFFEVIAGARYNSLSLDLRGDYGYFPSGRVNIWDPVVGGNASVRVLDDRLSLALRADIGGFGIGSDFTWQLFPRAIWHVTEWGSAELGYRFLSIDYERGSGDTAFSYDVLTHGLEIGVGVNF